MPEVTVLAGPNGAGKSTAYTALVRPETAFLSADYEPGGIVDQGRAMLMKMAALEEAEESFCLEVTMAGRSVDRWVSRWRDRGYTTRLLFISLPDPELAVARVERRVELGAHGVPGGADTIRRRYWRGLSNFYRLRDLFDTWTIYDNRDLDGPIPIASGEVLVWPRWQEIRVTFLSSLDTEVPMNRGPLR